MSRFYASLHARSPSRDELIKKLVSAAGEPEEIRENLNVVSLREARKTTHASPDQTRMFLSPAINGWVTLFVERFTEADEFAETISAATNSWTVFLWTDSHQAWGYSAYSEGDRRDRFVNDLSYYDGTEDEHDRDLLVGNPSEFQQLLEEPNELSDLVNLLQLAREEGMKPGDESTERQRERVTNEFNMFREALGIPHAESDYQYIQQGDTSDLLRWDEFVHITF